MIAISAGLCIFYFFSPDNHSQICTFLPECGTFPPIIYFHIIIQVIFSRTFYCGSHFRLFVYLYAFKIYHTFLVNIASVFIFCFILFSVCPACFFTLGKIPDGSYFSYCKHYSTGTKLTADSILLTVGCILCMQYL